MSMCANRVCHRFIIHIWDFEKNSLSRTETLMRNILNAREKMEMETGNCLKDFSLLKKKKKRIQDSKESSTTHSRTSRRENI